MSVIYGNPTSTPDDFIDFRTFAQTNEVGFSGTAAFSSSVAAPTGNLLSGLISDDASRTGTPTTNADPASNWAGRPHLSLTRTGILGLIVVLVLLIH